MKQYFFISDKCEKDKNTPVFVRGGIQLVLNLEYVIEGNKVILSEHIVHKYQLEDDVETEEIENGNKI